MLGGVGAGGKLALDGGLGQHVGVGDERIDHVNGSIERRGQGLEGLVHLGGIGVARRGLYGEIYVALGQAAEAVNQLFGFRGLIDGDFLGKARGLFDFGLVHHHFQGADGLPRLVANWNSGIGNVRLDAWHRLGDRFGGGCLLAAHGAGAGAIFGPAIAGLEVIVALAANHLLCRAPA